MKTRSLSLRAFLIIVISACIFIIVAIYYLAPTPKYELTEGTRKQAPGNFLLLKEGYTHYEIKGKKEAPVVVLVHGFSVPYYTWDWNFKTLVSAGFRVLRYDLLGRGFSDRPDVSYSGELYVRQLHALLKKLNIDQKVNLVGVSMGGAIIAKYADRYPKVVNSLIFFDPTGFPKPTSFMRKLLQMPLIGEYIMRVRGDAILLPGGSDFYHPENFPKWRERYKKQMQFKGFKRAILSTLRDFPFYQQEESFRKIGKSNIPTLLFWGEKDQVIPFRYHKAVMKAVPRATFFAIKNAGHMSNIEGAKLANDKMVSFLNKNS